MFVICRKKAENMGEKKIKHGGKNNVIIEN
jgi:hypothetical protein